MDVENDRIITGTNIPTGDVWPMIFETAPVPIAIIGLDHRFVVPNAKCCELLRYPRAQLQQKTFDELTVSDSLPWDNLTLDQVNEGLIDRYTMFKTYWRGDRTKVRAFLNVQPIRDSNGDLLGYVSYILPVEGAASVFLSAIQLVAKLGFIVGIIRRHPKATAAVVATVLGFVWKYWGTLRPVIVDIFKGSGSG